MSARREITPSAKTTEARGSSPIATPEEPRPRAPRMAIALGALCYMHNGVLVGPVKSDERFLVGPDNERLRLQIDAGSVSACWAENREHVVSCPGMPQGVACCRPLLKKMVRSSPIARPVVYRAGQTFTFRANDCTFKYVAGQVIDADASVLTAVLPNLVPGTAVRTREHLYRVVCKHCGPVLVPLPPEDE